jgi:hypothetical protein
VDVLDTLHKVSAVPWRVLQLRLDVVQQPSKPEPVESGVVHIVEPGVVIYEDDVLPRPVRWPLLMCCTDDRFHVVSKLLFCLALGELSDSILIRVLHLQGSSNWAQIRRPGPKPRKQMAAHVVLPQGKPLPGCHSGEQLHVFQLIACKDTDRHRLIMMPNSVGNGAPLICDVCNDAAAANKIVKDLKLANVVRDIQPLSDVERCILLAVDANPSTAGWMSYVPSVHFMAGLGLGPSLSNTSADLMLLDTQQPTVESLKRGVAVMVDGEHHVPWRSESVRAREQQARDRRISLAAAGLGYCVLRIGWRDKGKAMQIMEQAWKERSEQGWVKVSPQWLAGAHPVPCHDASGASETANVDRAGLCAHGGDVGVLECLAERVSTFTSERFDVRRRVALPSAARLEPLLLLINPDSVEKPLVAIQQPSDGMSQTFRFDLC